MLTQTRRAHGHFCRLNNRMMSWNSRPSCGSFDTHSIFTDNALLVFPHNDIIRDCIMAALLRILVVPIDPASPHSARLLTSEVPPHLALCTTSGKIMKAWGRIPAKECATLRASLIERATVDHARPPLSIWELDLMKFTHRIWSWIEYVPPSFVSDASDETLVEQKLSGGKDIDWAARSSRHEPKRRLLPAAESPHAPVRIVDSHISGVEDNPEEFAKASMARGDYEVDRKWLKGVKRWTVGTSGADADEALLIGPQIKDDLREQPRVVTSLDLEKPDYLSRRRTGTTT
ncbi:hypothetical protein B0H13DRAFT_1989521 [Mycena leptocephala]|nr:hypothetical protein B0H13DRAFT_1989521 [Mycena leptocephala]